MKMNNELSILTVMLGDRSYPIYIGADVYRNALLWQELIKGSEVVLISNTTVAPLYADHLQSTFHSIHKSCQLLILEDGEQYKTLETFDVVMTYLLTHNYHRDVTLVALGGGVIGDLVGFASACYQRGVSFIQCPTSLLAQVDSSVGGKTAVNHPLGKNMIGVFNQPKAVIIDPHCLQTLPKRELSAGLAEIIKYALLGDMAFFEWLEQNMALLFELDYDAIVYAISHCCQMKADIVNQDEKEQGIRALLNLGHTFGHAIESYMGYGTWLHGEAVAAGMMMASTLSYQLGYLPSQALTRIEALLKKAHLPTWGPELMNSHDFIIPMQRDKKALAGKMRFVLPTMIGQSSLFDSVTEAQLQQLIDHKNNK